ncbi:amidoligase family protein [Candidatus Accumulibacter sp. ACC003]|uniref:amidoligase family protein n=1 Tax=Candidatus Accumulibacter sp. ACC003 TaxID=2823334 RepID=UPI003450029C
MRPFFHPQSELSLVPGTPVFENLTIGFEVLGAAGEPIARCVDDLTLQDDLDRQCLPQPGCFRIVGDDLRLLHLVARTGRADAGPLEALAPVCQLFGTQPELFPGGMVRACDESRAPIAIATPLPGERERPCEIVTPPLGADRAERLEALLAPARELGFRIARESATHVHFDAAPLRSARTIARLVRFFERWGPELRRRVGTNPACRRLGGWPDELRQTVSEPGFEDLDWPAAQERLQALGLSKYCDFNLKNLVHDIPGKPTFEVRILPGLADAAPILKNIELFETLLRRLIEGEPTDEWAKELLGMT